MFILKRLLAPPIFKDEEKTHQAFLLHIILSVLITLPILHAGYILIQKPEESGRTLTFILVLEIINVISFIALRRGYVRQASAIQVIAIWVFLTAATVTSSSIYGVAYTLGNTLIITMAGILLGGRGAFTMTLLSIAEGGALVYAELHGWVPPDILDGALSTWAVIIILFIVGASLQYLSFHEMRVALKRAHVSEEQYRLISEISSDYTFSTKVDLEGDMHLSWVAGAFETISGFTFEEYVASGGWLAHLHPEDIEKDAEDTAIIKTNKPVTTEIRTIKKNGDINWVRVYAHPIWDDKQNRLAGIVGAVQDITQQKLTEAMLAYERDILQVFMDNIPGQVYFKDIESRFVRINQEQARFLGVETPQDAVGKTDFDFQSPELARVFFAEEKHIIETGQPALNYIEFNPTRDGKPLWFSTSKVPAKNEVGQIIGTIGISVNVTEQKLQKEKEDQRREMLEKMIQLGKQVAEVSDLQTTLKRIWHAVHDDLGFDRLGIYLYDPELNSMNGTYGTNVQGEMVEEWHLHIPIRDENIETVSFIRVLRQASGLYTTQNYAIEHGVPKGDIMSGVKDYAAVAARAGDKPVAVIAVDNLLSQQSISKEQLESLRLFAGYAGLAIENARLNSALQTELNERQTLIDELEAKNAELERFTYTVSHDLKSPLVTITGFLGYLEKDALTGNKEKIKSSVSRISRAVEKMQDLLNDLLKLSRVGRLMNPPENIPFEEIVNEAVEHVQGHLDIHKVRLEIQKDLPIIHGDRARLVEVMQNLIDNAAKYSDPNTQPIIEIGATENQNKTMYFVRDNGIGIDPQFHERIFGLFNKLNPHSDGTGIGLSLIKRIIEVHNGQIWVESEAGKGATFYFTLPTA